MVRCYKAVFHFFLFLSSKANHFPQLTLLLKARQLCRPEHLHTNNFFGYSSCCFIKHFFLATESFMLTVIWQNKPREWLYLLCREYPNLSHPSNCLLMVLLLWVYKCAINWEIVRRLSPLHWYTQTPTPTSYDEFFCSFQKRLLSSTQSVWTLTPVYKV